MKKSYATRVRTANEPRPSRLPNLYPLREGYWIGPSCWLWTADEVPPVNRVQS